MMIEGKKLGINTLNKGCRKEVKQCWGLVMMIQKWFGMNSKVFTTESMFSGAFQMGD